MARRRLALLLGQGDEEYQSEFVRGFLKEAYASDFDVCLFSMFIKYQNSRERELGDSNIYNLINYDKFDAVVILSDSIQTPGVAEELENTIKKNFSGPVLVIDRESKNFPVIWTDGYDLIYKTVSHLIEVHGYKDIAFLTGKKWHMHSIRRMEAYKQAMKDHGLPLREDRMFDGDFWYTSGSFCADKLLRNRDDLPEAVACANDCMAIGLCETFVKNGIRIPEDVAVTGYNGSLEAQTSPEPLTSAFIPSEEFGKHAVVSVMNLFEDKPVEDAHPKPTFFMGTSCGCESADLPLSLSDVRRKTWTTDISDETFYSIHNCIQDDFMEATDLHGLLDTIYSYIYQIKDVDSFHLCLNGDILSDGGLKKPNSFRPGFSKIMLHAIEYYKDKKKISRVGEDVFFPSVDMLPVPFDSDRPAGYIFLPVNFGSRSYGYAVISFGDEPRSYSEADRLWIQTVSRGLECLSRTTVEQETTSETELVITDKGDAKTPEGVAVSGALSGQDKENMELVRDILDNNKIKYYFQPIIRATDGSIFSYEALMRSDTEKSISPLNIIKYAYLMGRIDEVEKLTFLNVLGLIETKKELAGKKVFFNSIPGSRLSEEDSQKINELLQMIGDRAVIELTEQAEIEDDELAIMKKKYTKFGVGIAVDDYGTGYSNVSNLLRYMPNYVKIDRSLLSDIQNSIPKQHFVKSVIEFCHNNNILALAEGIETTEELHAVIGFGADLIQGYYTARPMAEIKKTIDAKIASEIKSYYEEYAGNEEHQVYVAGRTNRILLSNLEREGCNTILITNAEVAYRDINIIGNPGLKTDIHVEIQNGYEGSITLENVSLSNKDNQPVIQMAEDTNIILTLVGDNYLHGGGIRVPEGSKLSVEGDGNLTIELRDNDYFGIGGNIRSHHGRLEFYQDGKIEIVSTGKSGIGIGSGLGGEVRIHRGLFNINLNGDDGVGIGSFEGRADILVESCEMNLDVSLLNGVCIGSLSNEARIRISKSHLNCYAGGNNTTIVGNQGKATADIIIDNCGAVFNIGSDSTTSLGSFRGRTKLKLMKSSLKVTVNSDETYIFGGQSENTGVYIHSCDLNLRIVSKNGIDTKTSDDHVKIYNSRYRAIINEEAFEREIITV